MVRWRTDDCTDERRIIAVAPLGRSKQAAQEILTAEVAGATAIAATVPDLKVFRSGRDFGGRIGIVLRKI